MIKFEWKALLGQVNGLGSWGGGNEGGVWILG
jgi:hypothetical protein